MTPDDRRYTREHEWVLALENGNLRVGITDFAQDALGDVVFVALPEVGASVHAGDAIGEVESTKSVSDIYAPVSGTVTARNDTLGATPEVVNADAYGEGWMVEVELADPAQLQTLLDSAGYAAHVASA